MPAESHQLVHLCTQQEWERARATGERRPPSLEDSGFVHLSSPEQVHLPANRLFAGRTDMLLLTLDASLLGSPVRWEPGVPGDPEAMTFPHLYGPLPARAVTSVTTYLPDEAGLFAQIGHSGA
jgi:uncharacterized protein (DUF952 family)